MDVFEKATDLMRQQLGRDVVMALATSTSSGVTVRNDDGYYKDGNIYMVTYEASRKMQDISENSQVAVYKDLMCAQGIGTNLGNPKEDKNLELRREFGKCFQHFMIVMFMKRILRLAS